MIKLKVAIVVAGLLLASLGGGWLWGASGRWAAEAQWREAETRAQLAEARASLLAARVDLFEINFGKASADIERGKDALNATIGLLEPSRNEEAMAAVKDAVAKAGEAQQLAGSLDQAAGARLGDALAAIVRAGAAAGKK